MLILMCVVACLLFSGIMVGGVMWKREFFLHEYAPAVQQRFLERNPGFVTQSEQKRTASRILVKVAMAVVFTVLLVVMVYLAGARGFWSGMLYAYAIWLTVNWFDVFALDMGVFARWKKLRLPGTEDMDDAYKGNDKKHLMDGVFGTCIGMPICATVGAIFYVLVT